MSVIPWTGTTGGRPSGVARFVVKSMDEAVEWAKHVPFEALSRIYPGEDGAVGEIEIRQLFEPERSDASN